MGKVTLVLLLQILANINAQSQVNITVCKDSLCQINCTTNILPYNDCLVNTYGAFKFYNASVQYYSDSVCLNLIQPQTLVIINGSCNILNNQTYYYSANYVSQNDASNLVGLIAAIIVVSVVIVGSIRHCYLDIKKEQKSIEERGTTGKKADQDTDRPIMCD